MSPSPHVSVPGAQMMDLVRVSRLPLPMVHAKSVRIRGEIQEVQISLRGLYGQRDVLEKREGDPEFQKTLQAILRKEAEYRALLAQAGKTHILETRG